MNISKLALGTAQLGFNYGIANINGKPDKNSAMHILDYAYNNGITTFDTAPVYGNSEEILGEFISKKRKKDHKVPIIISKLKSFSRMEEHKFETLYD
ncbi:MAG: aldo/keto reductase, partial [Candidatus Odinarchaeota archaeon]